MSDIIIKAITEKDIDLIAQIKKLFAQMYEFFTQKGLTISLVKNGEEIWMDSILPTLNRLNILFVAVEHDEVIGFIYGYFSFTREHTGSLKVGVISETYVKPGSRKKGNGKLLVATIENWFISKDVHSIELQVICNNESALSFWGKSGYTRESIRFRKEFIKS